MAAINVNVVTEVSVDMKLNKTEANELLWYLRTATQQPTMPMAVEVPFTDIVRRLATALEKAMK